MITNVPTITICRNIFNDINTQLEEHNKTNVKIVNVFVTSRAYIINFNSTIEFEEILIPVEDIKEISYNKNKIIKL